jgi:hypothetical protein
VIIGYKWPDYYAEGSQLSYKVINALSEKDMDSLRATLCDITLETENIDAQIQAGFNFFKGKATFGKVGKLAGHELYDGDYDYHTTVIEAYEGISQISIISDDGMEVIIGERLD